MLRGRRPEGLPLGRRQTTQELLRGAEGKLLALLRGEVHARMRQGRLQVVQERAGSARYPRHQHRRRRGE